MSKDKNIHIIGAGISGLIAAIELEKRGYSPIIIEASDRVGGRVKTDYINGYQLDHGFQVLLTAYPELKKYLDLDALNLKEYKPGAQIYTKEGPKLFSDPLRGEQSMKDMIFSDLATPLDKFKVWRLAEKLKRTSTEKIFSRKSYSTMEYLRKKGFSDRIIQNFFKPFFSGIFLETELTTSSRLFEFIFKMFSEGHAAIPEKGMQEIPNQLYSTLQNSKTHFKTIVEKIEESTIITNKGTFEYDKLIIATDPGSVVHQQEAKQHIGYKSTINIYYSVQKQSMGSYIGLLPSKNKLTNNFTLLTDLSDNFAPEGRSLLSVSVCGNPQMDDRVLLQTVKDELVNYINTSGVEYVRHYRIPRALPQVTDPEMGGNSNTYYLSKNIRLAGDYLLGGSLNAAMITGREAVESLLDD